MLDFKKIIKSFKYAGSGLKLAWQEEHNFRFHVLVMIVVLGLMWWLDIKALEQVIIILAIAFMLVLELINTVFEQLVDMVKPRLDVRAGHIKDLMAATVLVASIGAIIIGLIIFLPYLRALI